MFDRQVDGEITDADVEALTKERERVETNKKRFFVDRGFYMLGNIKLPKDTFDEEAACKDFWGLVEKASRKNEQFSKDEAKRIVTQKYRGFLSYCERQKLSPKSVYLVRGVLPNYFLKCGLALDEADRAVINMNFDRVETVNRRDAPTYGEMRAILLNMPMEPKVFYAVLKSTGLRPGELIRVQIKHLHLDNVNPAWIDLPKEYSKTGNKTGKGRVCCMDEEARGLLREWMKTERSFLQKTGEDRLFPHRRSYYQGCWITALKKAKLDRKNEGERSRYILSPYSVKSYFETRGIGSRKEGQAIPGLSESLVEYQAGHVTNKIRELYFRPTPQETFDNNAKEYRDGQIAVWCLDKREEWLKEQRLLGLWTDTPEEVIPSPEQVEIQKRLAKTGIPVIQEQASEEEVAERKLAEKEWHKGPETDKEEQEQDEHDEQEDADEDFFEAV